MNVSTRTCINSAIILTVVAAMLIPGADTAMADHHPERYNHQACIKARYAPQNTPQRIHASSNASCHTSDHRADHYMHQSSEPNRKHMSKHIKEKNRSRKNVSYVVVNHGHKSPRIYTNCGTNHKQQRFAGRHVQLRHQALRNKVLRQQRRLLVQAKHQLGLLAVAPGITLNIPW